MIDIINQLLQIPTNDSYDETDDIILPNSWWGEIIYIFFCIKDIIKEQKDRQRKFSHLVRQIKIHRRWMKIK